MKAITVTGSHDTDDIEKVTWVLSQLAIATEIVLIRTFISYLRLQGHRFDGKDRIKVFRRKHGPSANSIGMRVEVLYNFCQDAGPCGTLL